MKKQVLFLILSLCLISVATVSGQPMEQQFDNLLQEQYKPNEPGATVLVAKQGKIIYHKAFGLANMELEVPMKPENVFEIGSITKQFTAVAILMLLEEGKLSLEDDITKFIPDYPTQGHTIKVHHLLNHTSGIRSYTSMNLMELARKDMKPMEIINHFKNEPMDFNPGEEWRYNNSGYIILGYIIEDVSGMSYEDFIEKNIFAPLKMNNSYYGKHRQIIKNRALGYQKQETYTNAQYLSLTIPYAAGSIMSTVSDLYKWQQALNNNILIKEETLKKAHTNYTLNNGTPINYGYGWGINEINGSPTTEHGGGIFGYTTNEIYLPEEDVYVTAFTNCDCNPPNAVTTKIAAIAIDKPFFDTKSAVNMTANELEKFVGVYDFEDKSTRIITLENNQLYSQREGSNKFKIFPENKTTFHFEDGFSSLKFNSLKNGVEILLQNRINKVKGVKTNKSIPAEKTSITVSETILKQYEGTYEIQPGFDLTITLEDGKLMTQATGQPKFEVFAETETKFFPKSFPAELEFVKDDSGNFSSCILHQGGQKINAKRKE